MLAAESKAALALSLGAVSWTAEMGPLPYLHSEEKVLGHFPTADIREEPSEWTPLNYPGTDSPLVINPH